MESEIVGNKNVLMKPEVAVQQTRYEKTSHLKDKENIKAYCLENSLLSPSIRMMKLFVK
jgi:hypothetical protein